MVLLAMVFLVNLPLFVLFSTLKKWQWLLYRDMAATVDSVARFTMYKGKIQARELLKGAAPVIAGIIGYGAASELFSLGKGGSIVFAIGSGIATNALITKLEAESRDKDDCRVGQGQCSIYCGKPRLKNVEV